MEDRNERMLSFCRKPLYVFLKLHRGFMKQQCGLMKLRRGFIKLHRGFKNT